MREFYRTVNISEAEIKNSMSVLQQQNAYSAGMKNELEQNMNRVVDSCNAAADTLGELHEDLERIAKSRRKPV